MLKSSWYNALPKILTFFCFISFNFRKASWFSQLFSILVYVLGGSGGYMPDMHWERELEWWKGRRWHQTNLQRKREREGKDQLKQMNKCIHFRNQLLHCWWRSWEMQGKLFNFIKQLMVCQQGGCESRPRSVSFRKSRLFRQGGHDGAGRGGGACGDLTKYYNDYFFRVANRIEFAKWQELPTRFLLYQLHIKGEKYKVVKWKYSKQNCPCVESLRNIII